MHAREEIRAHKDVELDVSTNDDLQAIAIALGSKFIENYSEMAKLCDQLARIMGINRTAALGVNRGGAHTPRHQHSPMGVLNVATGKKLWRFWRPDAPFDCDPDFILTVYAEMGYIELAPTLRASFPVLGASFQVAGCGYSMAGLQYQLKKVLYLEVRFFMPLVLELKLATSSNSSAVTRTGTGKYSYRCRSRPSY